MKDLTKGKPSRLILAFALPIFLANLLQLTYSLVRGTEPEVGDDVYVPFMGKYFERH